MRDLNFFELTAVTGGISKGYAATPADGKFLRATVTCASIEPPAFFSGCEIACDNNGKGVRIAAGESTCAVNQAMTCACDYSPKQDKGCMCTFEQL